MNSPTVDIIVPVWNSPFETRACLASVLQHSPEARLIIVDNGSSRETELMLEEFSEPLGERGLFIKSERNLGMVPAINIGLERSDGDFAVILRPHTLVTGNWLEGLLAAAQTPHAGIVSPTFAGVGAPPPLPITPSCTLMETFEVSFSALVLKREMHRPLGGFDESMDSGDWCLRDYVRRAWSRGYHTCITTRSRVICGKEAVFGSEDRRLQQYRVSSAVYQERWGIARHYAIYFGRDTNAAGISDTIETIAEGARQGHRFTLLLHRRQAADFRRLGWDARHTGIEVRRISPFRPRRDLLRQCEALKVSSPDMIPVRGVESCEFPGIDSAIPFSGLAAAIGRNAPSI
jgi:glycosyltransferase involved in cell wall biosynthesis